MNRRNWILLVVLVIQAGLIGWLYWPKPAATAAGPLLPALSADQITGVTIEDNTNRVDLAQVDGQWVLADRGNYPVTALAVSEFISDVLTIDTSRLVATSPASHARLQVSDADFVRRITLHTREGDGQVIYLGTSPNAGTVHVRAGDGSNVYLADGALSGAARTDLAGWIDTTYVSLDPAAVQQVTITNGFGSMELARGDDGAWSLAGLNAGETLDQAALQTLSSRIANISLTQPLGVQAAAEYGMDTPSALVTAVISTTAAGPKTVTLTLGAHDEASDSYVAKSSESDYFVRVAGFQVRDLVDAVRSNFVAAPAAAATALPASSAPITVTVPVTP